MLLAEIWAVQGFYPRLTCIVEARYRLNYQHTMTIQLNAEQEYLIAQAIEAGVIRVPEDVVEAGVKAIRQRLDAKLSEASAIETEEWSREFHAWVHSHPSTTPLLPDEAISRESIYGTSTR